ncbi:MAG: DUF4340 domain-containing protein [Fuerstiella sp.]
MNEQTRTLTFAGAAVLAALAAFGAWQANQPSTVDGFAEVGEPFFPDFKDPTKATQLTVVDYDKDTREAVTFSVKKNDDGLWTIPSHHNYPAEAEDRLARTATSLLNVEKTAVQSRNKDDWKRYGVVDPATDESATDKQRGQRLTLNDSSGNALVDLIVGNEVEGNSGHYYVREPEENTTYITELNVDLSAKFSDWIEPDLLKVSSSDIVKIVLDNYSIDEQRGRIVSKELLEFQKEDLSTTGDWKLVELNEDTEELDSSPISSIATNLDQLKIVGVRPKPEGLEDDLQIHPAFKQILQAQMQDQGYFIGPGKDGTGERLYSNEGELIAGTNKGVQYTLYFGEIARGTGKDIEVGLNQEAADSDDEADKDSEGDDEAADEEEGPRRYLLVKVDLNQELLGDKPTAPEEPTKPEILNEEAAGDAEDAESTGEAESKEAASTEAASEETATEGAAEPENSADEEESSCGPFDEESSADEADETAADASQEAASEQPADEESAKEDAPADSEAADAADAKDDSKPADEKASTEKPADETPAEEKPTDSAATDEQPKDPAETPAEPQKSPKELAQEQYDQAMADYRAAKSKYESDLKAWEKKLEEGQEKVEELKRRFDGWYYVISSDSFEKFRITRNDVVSKKEAEEKTDEAGTEPPAAAPQP